MKRTTRISRRGSKQSAGSAAVAEKLEARQLLSANTSDITTPTPWYFYQGVSASFLSAAATKENARIIDLKVQTTSPLTFNAALVQNTGAYSSGWYWWYGQTAAQVGADLTATKSRLVSLDPYVVNGSVYFAILSVPNTGTAAKAWWYYFGQTPTSIASTTKTNDARLIDLEPYSVNGTTYYADVMIRNTGSDAMAWYWYYGVTPSQISSYLTADKARIVDLNYEGDGRFDVIMQQSGGIEWWWYYGQSATALGNLAGQDGARIFDMDSYVSGDQRVFSAVMVNNSNALETSVGNILRSINNPTAVTGAYLRNVDGSVIADVNGERQFEPASAIKIVAAVTALLAVKNGTASLTTPITYYYDPSDPTNPEVNPDSYAHTSANAKTVTLDYAIQQMLQVSDNRTTLAIELYFGLSKLNSVAQSLGMTSTIWTQTVGNGVPGNYLTLNNAALLYDKIVDGSLLGTKLTSTLMGLILNQTNYGAPFTNVILQEAATVLGVSQTNAAAVSLANKFTADEIWGSKGGSYTLPIAGSSTYSSISTAAGYLELPIKSSNGAITYRKYTYGAFVDYATIPDVPAGQTNPTAVAIGDAERSAVDLMVSGIIESALKTWV